MNSLLLMSKRDVLDAYFVTRIYQCVIRVSALSEYLRDAFLLQACGDKRRSIHSRDS